MTMPEWWKHNATYVKAWGVHSATLMLVGFGIRYISALMFPASPSPGWTPAAIMFVVVSILVTFAISLALFRFLVLKLVVAQQPWAASVTHHPLRPYVVAWLGYVIVTIGIFVLTAIFLGAIFAVFPWASFVFRGVIAFLVFRMAIRKHILPHGGKSMQSAEQEGTEHHAGG